MRCGGKMPVRRQDAPGDLHPPVLSGGQGAECRAVYTVR